MKHLPGHVLIIGALLSGCSPLGLAGAPSAPVGGATAGPTAAPSPGIRVLDAWARPSTRAAMSGEMGQSAHGGGATSAVFFVLANEGRAGDALVGAGVAPDLAGAAEVHETTMEGGVARMQPVQRVEVPAGGRVEFKPGGYHIMLLDVKREIKAGDRVRLTLRFETSGELPVEADVRTP